MPQNRTGVLVLGNRRIPLPDGYYRRLETPFKGYILTCASCGEQWGKLDTGWDSGSWIIGAYSCPDHGGTSLLPYLALQNPNDKRNWEETLDAIGGELVRYEVMVKIERILR
jgi:hypothetical protein